MPTTCALCPRILPPSKATGRPATFCSIRCRRASEYEIRRIDKRIGDLETQLSDRRISNLKFFSGVDDPERIQAEIDRLKTRLLELFGRPDDGEGMRHEPLDQNDETVDH
ncbi:MAG: hypothetical protein JWP51_2667 [Bradyrhizobium sp.]|jgi:hypothetical protein|nr:hypothetical protein [Bradyrhizobium sp.]